MFRIICRYSSSTKKGIKIIGVPFKLNIDEARQVLHQNEGLFEKDIKDIEGKFSAKLEKAFIPMHCASINNIYTKYHVKYGIDRTEWRYEYYLDSKGRPQTRCVPYTVTDWYKLSGITTPVSYSDNDMQRFHKYADFEYPTDFIEQIVPMDSIREKCSNIVTDGKEKIYSHEKKISFAIDQIFDDLRTFEQNRLISNVKQQTGADHVDVLSINLVMDNVEINPFSYHAPVYLYVTEVEGRKICKMINGHTGNYAGDYVVSELKFGVTGTMIGGLLGLASFYVFPVYGTITRLLILRAGVGGFVSGLISMFGSKLYSEYKYDKRRKTLNSDKESNVMHEETIEDIQRKILSDKSIKYDYIKYQKEFDLLGLDLEEALTIESLKYAKINKLKQYHPDLNPPSKKETCNILTDQILEAYNTLVKLVKLK